MLEIVKRARAEQDLIDIWLYTFERWGEAQADAYLDELGQGIANLARTPKIGVDYSQIRPGYRRYGINRHRIYYRLTETAVEIVRVLHESMDVDAHLD